LNWLLTATILSAAATALGLANALWSWMNKGEAATAKRLDEIEETQLDHGRRIQSAESDLKHVPSKEDISGLKLQLSDMSGKLNTAESELGGVARTVRRIEDHLLGVKS
jgi:hypothetical protein